MIKFFKRLFSKPIMPIDGEIIKEKIVYIAIYPDLKGGFDNYLKQEWNANCNVFFSEIPKTPYAKIRMQIIELNEKFSHQRTG